MVLFRSQESSRTSSRRWSSASDISTRGTGVRFDYRRRASVRLHAAVSVHGRNADRAGRLLKNAVVLTKRSWLAF
jgi:hypothetical protein